MKKTIISLSVMFAGLFSGIAIAQNPATACPAQPCVQTEQKCAIADSTCTRTRPNPFEGLNLTTQQQEQLKALGPCNKGKSGDKRGVCRQSRKDYLNKVKGILTPEQYVQFLENSFVNAPAHKLDRGRHHNKRSQTMRGDRRQHRMTTNTPAVQQPTR